MRKCSGLPMAPGSTNRATQPSANLSVFSMLWMPHHAKNEGQSLVFLLGRMNLWTSFFSSQYELCFSLHLFSTTAQHDKYWLQFLIPLLVAILFAVDTGLFISTQQQVTFLLKIKRTRKGFKLLNPHPKPNPKSNWYNYSRNICNITFFSSISNYYSIVKHSLQYT